MKNIFGAFFRNTPATIMKCGRTFRLARTHPPHARSSGSETLSRSRSLVAYTIDMHESEFSEATVLNVVVSLTLISFNEWEVARRSSERDRPLARLPRRR